MSKPPTHTYYLLDRLASERCGCRMYASLETEPGFGAPVCVQADPEDGFKTNSRREAERELGRLDVADRPPRQAVVVVALRDPDTLKATQ